MSTEKQEKIADIVAEMRQDIADGTVGIWSDFGGEIARCYADRIEAAAKREREAGADMAQICGEIGEVVGRYAACHQPVTDCHGLNAAAMREALEKVMFYLPYFLQYMRLRREDTEGGGYYERILEVVNSALSAPPRNCDVGTAEEQYARFYSFCDKYEECKECPLWRGGGLVTKCCAYWAQMPYNGGIQWGRK